MTPSGIEPGDAAVSAACAASAPATAGHGIGTCRPVANAPSESSSAVRRERQLKLEPGRFQCSAVGVIDGGAWLPVRAETIRQGQSKLPDILNSCRSRTSVVPAPRLPPKQDIEAVGGSGGGRRNGGSRSGPARIAERRQSLDDRTPFPAVGIQSPRHLLRPGKFGSRRSFRVSDCRNDPQRAAANRSDGSAFRKVRMSNSLMYSNATCNNPSWARCQGLALFGDAWP